MWQMTRCWKKNGKEARIDALVRREIGKGMFERSEGEFKALNRYTEKLTLLPQQDVLLASAN